MDFVDSTLSKQDLLNLDTKYFDSKCAQDSFTNSSCPVSFDASFSTHIVTICSKDYDNDEKSTEAFRDCEPDLKLFQYNIRSVSKIFMN